MSFKKIIAHAFAAVILLASPCLTYAQSIDDLLNRASPPPNNSAAAAPPVTRDNTPYTIEQVIGKISDYMAQPDHAEALLSGTQMPPLFHQDVKADAFNKKFFGACSVAYPLVTDDGNFSAASPAFFSTLGYVLTDQASQKKRYLEEIKMRLDALQRNLDTYTVEQPRYCNASPAQYMANVKGVLDAVIHAGPEILANHQKLADAQKKEDAEKIKQSEAAYAAQAAIANAQQQAANLAYKKLAACQSSSPYKAYAASTIIIANRDTINNQQGIIQRQQEGAKISGFVDKQVMYDAGNVIASLNRKNEQEFKIYKQFGGIASSVESIQRAANPCSNL